MFDNKAKRNDSSREGDIPDADPAHLPDLPPDIQGERSTTIQSCTVRRIGNPLDLASTQFAQLYSEAFSGPPYFEHFSVEEVLQNVWHPHLQAEQIVLVAERTTQDIADRELLGLVCGHEALSDVEPSIREFLRKIEQDGLSPAPLKQVLFISELCVSTSARRQGLGKMLTLQLLDCARDSGYTHWMTRTAAEGSNSLRIFQGLGGIPFGPLHHVGDSIATSSDKRIYLCGEL